MTLMLMSLLLQDVTNSNRCHIATIRLHCKMRHPKFQDEIYLPLFSKTDLKLKPFSCDAYSINFYTSKQQSYVSINNA